MKQTRVSLLPTAKKTLRFTNQIDIKTLYFARYTNEAGAATQQYKKLEAYINNKSLYCTITIAHSTLDHFHVATHVQKEADNTQLKTQRKHIHAHSNSYTL